MTVYFVTMALATFFAALAVPRPVTGTPGEAPRRTGSGQLAAVLVGVILMGVAALRWRVGVDYWQYEVDYHEFAALTWDQLSVRDEPGIRVIAMLGSRLWDDPAMMFAIAAIITVGLTVRTIYSTSSAFALSILLYVLTTSWQGSFNGVRQYLACAILFAGHTLILNRKLLPYVAVVAVASLFHISAIVGLLLYWIPRSRIGFWRVIGLLFLAVVALSAYDQLGSFFNWVKDDDISSGSYFLEQINPLRIVLAAAPLVLYLLFTDKDTLRPQDHFLINMQWVNFAVFVASAQSAYIARFSIYTTIYLVLALPVILRTRDRLMRPLLTMVVLVAFSIYWYLETSSVSALSNFRWVFDR